MASPFQFSSLASDDDVLPFSMWRIQEDRLSARPDQKSATPAPPVGVLTTLSPISRSPISVLVPSLALGPGQKTKSLANCDNYTLIV